MATFGGAPHIHSESTLPTQAFFFGREKELAVIADAISPHSRTWGVLVDGAGGIGKTALAIRAAHIAPQTNFTRKVFLSAELRQLRVDGITLLNGSAPRSYIAILTELGRELGDPDLVRLPEHERANAVRRLLAGSRCLLVLDNPESLPEGDCLSLYEFLSRIAPGL
jgi:hypothetical protein